MLLDAGADMEVVVGVTRFLAAWSTGRFDAAQHLARRGADVNAQDANGRTALHLAIGKDFDPARLTWLVRHGAHPGSLISDPEVPDPRIPDLAREAGLRIHDSRIHDSRIHDSRIHDSRIRDSRIRDQGYGISDQGSGIRRVYDAAHPVAGVTMDHDG